MDMHRTVSEVICRWDAFNSSISINCLPAELSWGIVTREPIIFQQPYALGFEFYLFNHYLINISLLDYYLLLLSILISENIHIFDFLEKSCSNFVSY